MKSQKRSAQGKKVRRRAQTNKKSARPRSPRSSSLAYRGMTIEIYLKLILTWAITIGAVISLLRLIPYHFSQQAKLDELKIQVQETDARVNKLRTQLNHNFDPQQAQSLKKQYSSLTSPNQSRIYWLESGKKNQHSSDQQTDSRNRN